MKRLLTLMVAMVMMSLCAKAEHLTFMGIPIDGSYTQFEKALLAKGFTPNNDPYNPTAPNMKLFDGVWDSKKTELLILYTPTTQTMCSVIVFIYNESRQSADCVFESLRKSIQSKYPDSIEEAQEPDLFHAKSATFNPNNGTIELSLLDSNKLRITYSDDENNQLYSRELREESERNEDI